MMRFDLLSTIIALTFCSRSATPSSYYDHANGNYSHVSQWSSDRQPSSSSADEMHPIVETLERRPQLRGSRDQPFVFNHRLNNKHIIVERQRRAAASAVVSDGVESAVDEEEVAAAGLLRDIDRRLVESYNEAYKADWRHATDINAQNEQAALAAKLKLSKVRKQVWQEVIKFDWRKFDNETIRRQLRLHSVLGTPALPEDKEEEFNRVVNDMETIYSTAKTCAYNDITNCGLSLEPELTEIFAKSRDPLELKHSWIEWRKQSGNKMKQLYKRYAELSNQSAKLNNVTDGGEYWLLAYESDSFPDEVLKVWNGLRPLYEQLHAYIRHRLRNKYGEQVVSERGPIPAHLLGNMWAQTWGNVLDFASPYPNKTMVDVTPQMLEQGYTPLRMFRISEEFFTSLGLSPMPDSFWRLSMIEKPNDREVVCHASAWDFLDGDVRIKQCTEINMEYLVTVHHEMGHVQYFLQYQQLPIAFREGANPGFHEAVGDVLALSVASPRHLRKIGLLPSHEHDDHQSDINFLLSQALEKIAFLPYAYLIDRWRWDVFAGNVQPDHYNCHYWKLRDEIQGMRPPVVRSEDDFDPPAKYHVASNVEYIRYFVSTVIQFQFHKALCQAAGQYDANDPERMPLHRCDIHNSKEAGKLLGSMLRMGLSKNWKEAMQAITGQRDMDSSALREYFRPLEKWLTEENKRNRQQVGWKTDGVYCSTSAELHGKDVEVTTSASSSTRSVFAASVVRLKAGAILSLLFPLMLILLLLVGQCWWRSTDSQLNQVINNSKFSGVYPELIVVFVLVIFFSTSSAISLLLTISGKYYFSINVMR